MKNISQITSLLLSHDLTKHPNINISQLARGLVTQEIGQMFGLKVVIYLPIPRAESKFPGSLDITMALNDQVRTMTKDKTNVNVWVHKGLFKRDSHYLDRHGVYLNFKGTIKYFHSVQVAVRHHVVRL